MKNGSKAENKNKNKTAKRKSGRSKLMDKIENGTSTSAALRALYADGGVLRFYRGFVPALFQGPLSRFGDAAANTGGSIKFIRVD